MKKWRRVPNGKYLLKFMPGVGWVSTLYPPNNVTDRDICLVSQGSLVHDYILGKETLSGGLYLTEEQISKISEIQKLFYGID